MANFFHVIMISLICSVASAQELNQRQYNVINVVLPELSTWVGKNDTLRINHNTVPFIRQKWFFTKDLFDSYAAGVVGVDGEKVRQLIQLVDFEYLREQKSKIITLDTSKLIYKNFTLSDGNDLNLLDGKKRYSFAAPIFSKDKKIAFIYLRDHCGHMDCSSDLVRVYKKRGSKWIFYIMFPM